MIIRVLVAILVFTATMVSYMLRVNLNIAIVTMTDNATSMCANQSSEYNFVNDEGHRRFCWTEGQKGWVKGAFFYGYIVLQVSGGTLAERFGTRRVLGVALATTAILTLLTPLVAVWNIWALFGIRLLMGLAEGVTFPVLPPLAQKWVPEQERTKFLAFSYSGGSFGTVITFPLCGYILETLDWEAVYYITGGASLIWCVIWFLCLTDEPRDHPWISKDEANFIEQHRPKISKEFVTPPYWKMLKNPGLWAIMFCDFANGWGIFMIITEGPNFISNVLHQSIANNGLLNAAPHLMALLMMQVFGVGSDWILARKLIGRAKLSKICECFGFAVPALALGVMGYFTQDWRICLAILTVGFGFRGGCYAGHIKNPAELSPNYSGTVYGFSNGFGSISGFLTPLVTAAFTEDNPEDPANWRYVFFTATGLYIAALLGFIFFGRFEPQPFNEPKITRNTDDMVPEIAVIQQ